MVLPPQEIGQRIKLIREQHAIPISELAAACGTSHEVIEQLEGGVLEPLPGDYILIIARRLNTDFRYFISKDLDEVENGTRRVFRALNDPKPTDLLAMRRFMLFCASEQEMEQLLNVPSGVLPPDYSGKYPSAVLHKNQGRRAAIQERRRLGIGNRPIENVFEILRTQNIRLSRYRLDDSNLSGVTVAHPRAGLCVLVNYDDDLYRQFFSAAHEYAHVLFERSKLETDGCVVSYRYTKDELIEIRANAFAAEFLLPADALASERRPHSHDEVLDAIRDIALKYHANTGTVAIRMKELGWIDAGVLKWVLEERPVTIPKKEKRDPDIPEGLSSVQVKRIEALVSHGISARFLERLRRGLTEEVISFGRFAEMLDMTPEQAWEFVVTMNIAL
jgi:Zn-dependent peptidase ImmA (M78 family)